jgi:hypothetical protein
MKNNQSSSHFAKKEKCEKRFRANQCGRRPPARNRAHGAGA